MCQFVRIWSCDSTTAISIVQRKGSYNRKTTLIKLKAFWFQMCSARFVTKKTAGLVHLEKIGLCTSGALIGNPLMSLFSFQYVDACCFFGCFDAFGCLDSVSSFLSCVVVPQCLLHHPARVVDNSRLYARVPYLDFPVSSQSAVSARHDHLIAAVNLRMSAPRPIYN